jgi:uncharacterized protein (DUF2164 family)
MGVRMKRFNAVVQLQQYLNKNFGQEFNNVDAELILEFLEDDIGMKLPSTGFWNIDKDDKIQTSSDITTDINGAVTINAEDPPEVCEYWIEVDRENKNPTGNICWAYYPGDRPIVGTWIKVREVK